MTSLMTVKLGGLDFEKLEEQDIKSFVHKHEQDVPLLLQITNGCHGEANHLQTDSVSISQNTQITIIFLWIRM